VIVLSLHYFLIVIVQTVVLLLTSVVEVSPCVVRRENVLKTHRNLRSVAIDCFDVAELFKRNQFIHSSKDDVLIFYLKPKAIVY
jgi:hypothetical protein